MIQLKRILAATDFSEFSTNAVRYACELAEKFDAELHLLHVLEAHAVSTPVFAAGLALNSWMQESRAAAEKSLASALDPASRFRGPVVRKVVEGPAFPEIIRYAVNLKIDLIVMGTHGRTRTGIQHLILGSVAEKVVRKADCPVLTISLPDE